MYNSHQGWGEWKGCFFLFAFSYLLGLLLGLTSLLLLYQRIDILAYCNFLFPRPLLPLLPITQTPPSKNNHTLSPRHSTRRDSSRVQRYLYEGVIEWRAERGKKEAVQQSGGHVIVHTVGAIVAYCFPEICVGIFFGNWSQRSRILRLGWWFGLKSGGWMLEEAISANLSPRIFWWAAKLGWKLGLSRINFSADADNIKLGCKVIPWLGAFTWWMTRFRSRLSTFMTKETSSCLWQFHSIKRQKGQLQQEQMFALCIIPINFMVSVSIASVI